MGRSLRRWGRSSSAIAAIYWAMPSATSWKRRCSRKASSTSRSSANRPSSSRGRRGFAFPGRTKVLVAPLERIGDDYPLSREKLCPVLGLYVAATREAAMIACRAMTRRSGGGHSASIYARDPGIILRYGEEMNVLRISVNVGNSLGASGFETHLAPTMTIGTGYFGRSSVSENVGPQHLMQWVKMAWNKDAHIRMPSFAATDRLEKPRIGSLHKGEIDYDFGNHPP